MTREELNKLIMQACERTWNEKTCKEIEQALSQEPTDAVSRILNRMWNCRGKHTTSIDKVAMEQIIRDELTSVTPKSIECDDAISRDAVLKKIDDEVEQLPSVTQKSTGCDDAISREAAIKVTCNDCKYDCRYRESKEYCDCCGYIDRLRTLPSVTSKPIECDDAISREMVVGYLCTHCPDDAECFEDCNDIKNIKALPPVTQKPIECDDAISREELLKAIDTWDKFGYTETGCFMRITKEIDNYVPYVHLEDVITAIQKLPLVTQKSGKWDRLYSWLNDMRLGIAPDETVTDIDERNCRESQTDILDEIMKWMIKAESEEQDASID